MSQPLLEACATGNLEYIAEHSESFGEYDDLERNATMIATLCGQNQVVQISQAKEGCGQDADGNTALMYACLIKSRYGLSRCLKSDKEQPNYQGNTALMCCAISGFTEGAEKLVKYESGMTNDYGQTALMLAAA